MAALDRHLVKRCILRLSEGGVSGAADGCFRINDNLDLLRGVPALILRGTTRPAVFFAYPGKPSTPDDPDTRLIELCSRQMDIDWTLQARAAELGESDLGADDFVAPDQPSRPEGALTLAEVDEAMAQKGPRLIEVVCENLSRRAAAGSAPCCRVASR